MGVRKALVVGDSTARLRWGLREPGAVTLLDAGRRVRVEEAVEELVASCSAEDDLLLVLPGPAFHSRAGDVFVALPGTDEGRPHSTAVSEGVLRGLLGECAARTKTVLLERAGATPRLGEDVEVVTGPVEDLLARLDAGRGLSARPLDPPRAHVDLLGVVSALGGPEPGSPELRAPIGLDREGAPVSLDLRNRAVGGDGPSGLCVGAAGSGKSRLLRTVVAGLIATHPPDVVNVLAIDPAGQGTFAGLDEWPHVSAVVTDVRGAAGLRLAAALAGEVDRRQQALRDAGNLNSASAYDEARAAGADLPPLPALLVVVDDAARVLADPALADRFRALAWVGRTLHLHVLLAARHFDEGLVNSHGYHLVLRTETPEQSRAFLGDERAHHQLDHPGSGFLRTERGVLRFQAADTPRRIGQDTALGSSTAGMAMRGSPAHQVLVPPLGGPEPLDALLPDLRVVEGRGLSAGGGGLTAVVGVVDSPYRQRHWLLRVDLSGAAGHVAVVGGPGAGKSTALCALVLSLALTHTPGEVQFHCVGDAALLPLAGLPHAGGVRWAGRSTVEHLTALLLRRERAFAESGLDSTAEFRLRWAHLPDDPGADVFLVVGDVAAVPAADLLRLAERGLACGVHVVIAADRWADLHPALAHLLGTRLELRLADPGESAVDSRLAALLPAGAGGRGWTADRLEFQLAAPRVDGGREAADLRRACAEAVAAVDAAWSGPRAPGVPGPPDL
ncbi:FtsK/SpoIIIE domain-containing protein [Actinokineospora sp. G85]|uniref:FtsK/SpoIIIE domain-containing protein n=1 Tax=Actinokineospora sp. G85 TaxID=3406626 RepID=UPI003C72EBC1